MASLHNTRMLYLDESFVSFFQGEDLLRQRVAWLEHRMEQLVASNTKDLVAKLFKVNHLLCDAACDGTERNWKNRLFELFHGIDHFLLQYTSPYPNLK